MPGIQGLAPSKIPHAPPSRIQTYVAIVGAQLLVKSDKDVPPLPNH